MHVRPNFPEIAFLLFIRLDNGRFLPPTPTMPLPNLNATIQAMGADLSRINPRSGSRPCATATYSIEPSNASEVSALSLSLNYLTTMTSNAADLIVCQRLA